LFLAETYRVLKPNCVHRINTPNLLASMRSHSNFGLGIQGVFREEWDRYFHKNVLTKHLLEEMNRMIGYRKVLFTEKNGSCSPLMPPEFRPASDRGEADGNIFADLIK